MILRGLRVASVASGGPAERALIVIPARFESSRFPGKPLVRLAGPGGVQRSLVEWSWRAAALVGEGAEILIATDDSRIRDEVERFGGRAVLTPTGCGNGTERCAAVLAEMADAPDLIVNLQGDAPLTPAPMVRALLARMTAEPDLPVATPAVRCSPQVLRHLLDDRAAGRVGGTTVVFNSQARALYFSKEVIPYQPGGADGQVFLHLGVYCYRGDALRTYACSPVCSLEQLEGLEQLRFLDAGIPIGVEVCDAAGWNVIEVNNPTDTASVETELRRRYGAYETAQ